MLRALPVTVAVNYPVHGCEAGQFRAGIRGYGDTGRGEGRGEITGRGLAGRSNADSPTAAPSIRGGPPVPPAHGSPSHLGSPPDTRACETIGAREIPLLLRLPG